MRAERRAGELGRAEERAKWACVGGRKELGQEGRMWAAGERGGDLGRAGPAWVLGLGWFSIYLGFSLFYF